MKEVNEQIIPSLGLDLGKEKISESTARRWLLKLGYEMKECRKGMYVDGHEHDDVSRSQPVLGGKSGGRLGGELGH